MSRPVSGIMTPMEKPELIVDSKPEHNFLRAHCSLCRVRFNLVGNELAEKAKLRQMFDVHARLVHDWYESTRSPSKP
jgi:hypothetical protein